MLIWAHSWTYCTCVFLYFAIVKQTDRCIVNRHPKKTCRYQRLIVFCLKMKAVIVKPKMKNEAASEMKASMATITKQKQST